jgi:hypothetical protein
MTGRDGKREREREERRMEGGRKGGRDRREIERDWGIGVVSGSVCARKRECRGVKQGG